LASSHSSISTTNPVTILIFTPMVTAATAATAPLEINSKQGTEHGR
jgi:hypothetical protein